MSKRFLVAFVIAAALAGGAAAQTVPDTLGRIKAALGRELDEDERKRYRQSFVAALRAVEA